MGRALAFAIVSALAFTAVVAAVAGGPRLNALGDRTASGSSQLSETAQAAISDTLGHDQAAFHILGGRHGLIATNSSQRLTARFGADGVLVHSGAATFGLHLLAYGDGQTLTTVRAAAPQASANRVLYRHGAITEWYANGPLGLEQGFDVQTAPRPGSTGELSIVLGLHGNVQARSDGSGGLLLAGPNGQRLRYTGLSANDARGRSLRTSLSFGAGRAVIRVQTRGAVYPIRVDPFIQVAKFGDPAPVNFGGLGSFAIDIEGATAAVSVTNSATVSPPPNAVDIFVANSGRWDLGATRIAQLTDAAANPTDEQFGASLSLTPDGRTLAVGAPSATVGANTDQGAVLVYEEPAAGWTSTGTPTARLTDAGGKAGDTLGRKAVSISGDGTTIAAGAPGRPTPTATSVGAVDVFGRIGMHWMNQSAPQATLTDGSGQSNDQLGISVALSRNGSAIVAGAWGFKTFTGEARVFQQPSGGWVNSTSPNATLLAPNGQSNDFFGTSSAISADAKTVVIGATGYSADRGAAFVFTSPTGAWTGAPVASATLMSSNGRQEQVGWSVATDGRVAVSGTPSAAVGGNTGQGAAYVFVEPPAGWASETETQRLLASDGKMGDGLGQTVGYSNGTVIAAAPQAGAPGHQDAGFIYAFGSFPSTSVSFAPAVPDGSNGWYVHPVQVFVSAADLVSPVTAIRCVLDPAAPPFGFGALPGCAFLPPAGGTVSASGPHVVFSAAVNAAGYAGAPAGRAFYIDTVPPQLVCSPPPIFRLHGVGGLVTASVSDAISGPAAPLVAQQANVSRIGTKFAIITGRDVAGNSTTVRCRYSVFAPRLPTQIHYTFSAFATFTAFDSVKATKFPSGGTLTITCRGGGCPFKRRVIRVPSTRLVCKRHHKHCKKKPAPAFTTLNLTPLIANHHLRVNTRLTFVVRKPAFDGVIQIFTIRSNASPRVVGPSCLAPGSTKPGKNC